MMQPATIKVGKLADCERLEGLAKRLRSTEEVSVDEFIQTIEVMSLYEKYYTPEQLNEIKERGKQVGEERIRQVEAEWPLLVDQRQEHLR